MKAHQIFQNISPETGEKIIEFLREEDRDTYRATLASLAGQRRLRPIFVQRKSRPEQAAWMLKNLQLRQCDGICEHLLQTWLMKGYQDVLVKYLDGVGIAHDGKGEVEDLPDEVDAEKLKSTVDTLVGEYDPELIAIYLHTFNLQKADGWESITALLDSDPKLKLAGQVAAEAEAEAEAQKEEPPAKTKPSPVVDPEPEAEEVAETDDEESEVEESETETESESEEVAEEDGEEE